MKSNYSLKDDNENIEINISNNNLGNIKCKYILSKIFKIVNIKKSFEIVKYNKKMQNKLNLSIKDYKEFLVKFSTIEIEIVPAKKIYSKFINICENEKLYYHIYINDNREEIKNKHYIYENDKITKIRIIIDYQIKSFENLFKNSKCIEYINFIKFHRNNITNMSNMFSKCSSLK